MNMHQFPRFSTVLLSGALVAIGAAAIYASLRPPDRAREIVFDNGPSDSAAAVATASAVSTQTARTQVQGNRVGRIATPTVVSSRAAQPALVPTHVSSGPILPTPTPTFPPGTHLTFAFDPPQLSVQPGAAASLSVKIDATYPVRGAQFGLEFDPAYLQLDDVAEGDYFSNWARARGAKGTLLYPPFTADNTRGQTNVGGIVILGGPMGKGVEGSGTLATVHLHVRRDAPVGTARVNLVAPIGGAVRDNAVMPLVAYVRFVGQSSSAQITIQR
jgi:hypothetical protein